MRMSSRPREVLYAFPPFLLISQVLDRVREQRLRLTLVAPLWPKQLWYADLVNLSQGLPWPLPIRHNLLSQAEGQILHPAPRRLKLAAWCLDGSSGRHKGNSFGALGPRV